MESPFVPGYALYGMLSTNRKTAPWFVGNYIHNSSALAWHHQKKQRVSRHARQRPHQLKTGRSLNQNSTRRLSESGYETVGEQQCGSPITGAEGHASTSSNSSSNANAIGNACNTASSNGASGNSSGVSANPTLQRLLKDLHRCDVFISRSLSALNQHCLDGEREMNQVFSLLLQHVKARENDLVHELHLIRKAAVSILERRKATLAYLKQTASTSGDLEDYQVSELVEQMKQFVADRKVDEEIGSVNRFHGDIDDILPHIMGFGQVNNVRHLYTEWEENPGKMILRSKSSVILLPFTPSPTASQGNLATATSSPQDSEVKSSGTHRAEGSVERGRDSKRGEEAVLTLTDSGFISVPESSVSGGSDDDTSSHDGYPRMATRCLPQETRNKYSPEQLKTIQSRVKDSLKNQGVYLYDPVTGAGPPQDLEGMEGKQGRQEGGWRNGWERRKKTPTQLRRERKKRQKEREKKQRELEKAVSEESDAQASSPLLSPISPLPPLPTPNSLPGKQDLEEDPTSSPLLAEVGPAHSAPLPAVEDSTHSTPPPAEEVHPTTPLAVEDTVAISTSPLAEEVRTTPLPAGDIVSPMGSATISTSPPAEEVRPTTPTAVEDTVALMAISPSPPAEEVRPTTPTAVEDTVAPTSPLAEEVCSTTPLTAGDNISPMGSATISTLPSTEEVHPTTPLLAVEDTVAPMGSATFPAEEIPIHQASDPPDPTHSSAKDHAEQSPPPAEDQTNLTPPPAENQTNLTPPPAENQTNLTPPPAEDSVHSTPLAEEDSTHSTPPPAEEGSVHPSPPLAEDPVDYLALPTQSAEETDQATPPPAEGPAHPSPPPAEGDPADYLALPTQSAKETVQDHAHSTPPPPAEGDPAAALPTQSAEETDQATPPPAEDPAHPSPDPALPTQSAEESVQATPPSQSVQTLALLASQVIKVMEEHNSTTDDHQQLL